MNEIKYPDHLQSCRVCLDRFGEQEKQITLTNLLKKQFFELTNYELKTSELYSNKICIKCKLNLQSFSHARAEYVKKQTELTKFVEEMSLCGSGTNHTETNDLDPVTIKNESDDEQNISNEPSDDSTIEVKDEDDNVPLSLLTSKSNKLNEEGINEVSLEFKFSKKHRRNVDKSFHCKLCSSSFETSKTLENHVLYNHRETLTQDEIRRIKKRNREDRMRICPTCGVRVDQLNKHINQFHLKIKRYFCDNCSYSSFKRFDMVSHVLKHRKFAEKEFICSLCGTEFTRKCGLRQHMRDFHSNHGPFICSYCNKKFNTLTLMRKHIKWIHENASKIRCPECDKEISSLCLKKHLLRDPETMDQKFKCVECHKEFSNKRCLTYHQTTHQGRNFVCEFPDCGKTYTSLNQLHSHQKRHTDSKHLACPFEGCNKEYFKQQNLRLHIATVHDTTTRKNCPVKFCKYSTGAYNYMRDHMFRHKELKPEEKREYFLAIKQMNLAQ